MSFARSSYCSKIFGKSSAVNADGSDGSLTTGYIESSVKPRSSAMWKISSVKSTL